MLDAVRDAFDADPFHDALLGLVGASRWIQHLAGAPVPATQAVATGPDPLLDALLGVVALGRLIDTLVGPAPKATVEDAPAEPAWESLLR